MLAGVAVHGKTLFIQRIEAGIAVPGFVKVQAIHALPQQLLRSFHIVAQTVVCGVGDNGVHRRGVHITVHQRIFRNGTGNGRFGHVLRRNGADDAVMIARGEHVGGNRTGHDNGMLNGFMGVPVAQGHLPARDRSHHDHAVGCGGTVGDVIGAMRAEHLGGVLFSFTDGAGVIQQGTQLAYGNGQIGTEQIFSEEVEKGSPRRGFHEGSTAGVPRRVPGVLMRHGEFGQSLEHGRQHMRPVVA